jgi:hypothetical protein
MIQKQIHVFLRAAFANSTALTVNLKLSHTVENHRAIDADKLTQLPCRSTAYIVEQLPNFFWRCVGFH